LIRDSIHEEYHEVEWDSVVDKAGSETQRNQEKYGRDSFAIVSTGQMYTE